MMPRQLWLFRFGCWASFAAAAVHLVGQFLGPTPPANDTERQLTALATSYHFAMPGGAERSLMDFLHGFGWVFALFAATIGAVGLVVARRAHGDASLMNAVAKVLAASCGLLLVISLVYFFIVPTVFIALMATCFTCAAVRAPARA